MTKKDFVKIVKEKLEAEECSVVTLKDTEFMIESVFDAIAETLKEEKKLSVYGFGTFSVVKRNGRTGKLPKGQVFNSVAKNTIVFSPATTLKREFND